MGNVFLERQDRTKNLSNSHRRSKKQERELAGKLGGRLTSASGAKDEKGDVRIKGVVRLEAKTTKNASFSVTREMVDKIETAAVAAGEMPVLVIEFNDGNGRKLKELAIMPMYALETLLGGQK
jgi:Holliday junction resolvase